MRFQSLLITLLAAGAVVACQDVVGADGDLSGDEVNELAESMIASSFDASSQVAEADASWAGRLFWRGPGTGSGIGRRTAVPATCPWPRPTRTVRGRCGGQTRS